jgi:hypothetical protein
MLAVISIDGLKALADEAVTRVPPFKVNANLGSNRGAESEDPAASPRTRGVVRRCDDAGVYALGGRNERADDALGRAIAASGAGFAGREIGEAFTRLTFAEQLACVRGDLRPAFWHGGARLLGRSYGAYLLLHVLVDLDPFPGRVCLCSPVLGPASARDGWFGSRPPRAGKLMEVAGTGRFPAPASIEIHTGADDPGCDPRLAARFAAAVARARLHVVPGASHDLPPAYLAEAIGRFLCVEA